MSLAEYQRKFESLNVNVSGGRQSPHKICMLLAVLDLARSGELVANRIAYDTPLLCRYLRYFSAIQAPGDHPNPYFPFFHLTGALRASTAGAGRQASFWHILALPGQEAALNRMTSARTHRDITEVVDFATLDEELFHLLQSPRNIDALGETLARHWFNRGLEDLAGVAAIEREITMYERTLRMNIGAMPSSESPPPKSVRDPAFRRVVVELYDYRCAASGERVRMPDGTPMVEAAHIQAFSDGADDDPRNGIALTPDMHWAMDNYLIAPWPDFKWHVHPRIDERVPDFARFVRLAGKPILPPTEKRMWPKLESLEWRKGRFLACS